MHFNKKITAVRDEIAGLNEILNETKFYREDVTTRLRTLEEHTGNGFSAMHNHIASELKNKFDQREIVFVVGLILITSKFNFVLH